MEKVQSVAQPGALSKQIVNSTMNQLITEKDCGSNKGVALSSTSREVLDRHLASPVTVRGKTFPSGTLVTPELQTTFENNKVGKIVVRSPLRCRSHTGMCQSCFGLDVGGKTPELGTNVGVLAAQSIGGPSVQLSMRSFHTGGTVGAGKSITSGFSRLSQLLKVPEELPDSATLSRVSGKVERVEKDPAGGWGVYVGGERHYVPQRLSLTVSKGTPIAKGDAISSGPIHPKELLELTNVNKVQNYLTDEMHELFSSEGVRRRNMEVVVRALTSLAQVTHSGDNQDILRGDVAPVNRIEAWNKDNPQAKKVQYKPVLKGLETLPLDMQEDWLSRLQYRRLKETVAQGAQERWSSDIHGASPVPALVYAAEFGKPEKGGASKWAY